MRWALNELAAQDGSAAFQRPLRSYCSPALLVVDKVGYLSYDNRHADTHDQTEGPQPGTYVRERTKGVYCSKT